VILEVERVVKKAGMSGRSNHCIVPVTRSLESEWQVSLKDNSALPDAAPSTFTGSECSVSLGSPIDLDVPS